jgi:hypothetical protein
VIPVWSLYVKTDARLPSSGEPGSWAALEALVGAVEADSRTLGASVSGEPDGASVYLSVEADAPNDAKALAEEVVAAALKTVNLDARARALQLYDADGNFIESA